MRFELLRSYFEALYLGFRCSNVIMVAVHTQAIPVPYESYLNTRVRKPRGLVRQEAALWGRRRPPGRHRALGGHDLAGEKESSERKASAVSRGHGASKQHAMEQMSCLTRGNANFGAGLHARASPSCVPDR